VRKLEDKINLIRYTIGSDQSVLDEEPIPIDFTEDLYSRDEKKRLEAFNKIFETSELLAAEDLFMDDLREFDRNEKFEEAYKEKIRKLPRGKWGKIQMRKEEDEYTHLAHLMDDKDEAGYFIVFDKERMIEQLTTAEGLLAIKASSDQNERFKDNFKNKPQAEALIANSTIGFDIGDEDTGTELTARLNEALVYALQKMQEFGTPLEDVERVYKCGIESKNAYINKQYQKLLRLINRLQRRNKHVDSSIFGDLIVLARNWNPEEKTERPPIAEILQIFA
jgi:hypothetical protein